MLSVRLVTLDHYMSKPVLGVDPANDTLGRTSASPVLRLYGPSSTGLKACVHIHGVYPYLYVPYEGGENTDRDCMLLTVGLDRALQATAGERGSTQRFVHSVTLVSGIPLYGYHQRPRQFMKIYFLNPYSIKKAADLLLNGAILNKKLQPHESHIPFTQQFMIDYNLFGMSYVNFAKFKYRRNPDAPDALSGVELDLLLPGSVTKLSHSFLEVDVVAEDILNRLEDRSAAANPGLAGIWAEEKDRRHLAGRTSLPTPMLTQSRTEKAPFGIEADFLIDLKTKVAELRVEEPLLSTPTTEPRTPYPAELQEDVNILDASTVLDLSQLVDEADILINDEEPLVNETIVHELTQRGLEEEPADGEAEEGRGEGAESEEDEDGPDMTQPLDAPAVLAAAVRERSGDSSSDSEEEFWREMADHIFQLDGAVDSSDPSDDQQQHVAIDPSRQWRSSPSFDASDSLSNIMSILGETDCLASFPAPQTPAANFWGNTSSWEQWSWNSPAPTLSPLAPSVLSPPSAVLTPASEVDRYSEYYMDGITDLNMIQSPLPFPETPLSLPPPSVGEPILDASPMPPVIIEEQPEVPRKELHEKIKKLIESRSYDGVNNKSLTLRDYLKNLGEIIRVEFKVINDTEMVVIEYRPTGSSGSQVRSRFLIKPLIKFIEEWNLAEIGSTDTTNKSMRLPKYINGFTEIQKQVAKQKKSNEIVKIQRQTKVKEAEKKTFDKDYIKSLENKYSGNRLFRNKQKHPNKFVVKSIEMVDDTNNANKDVKINSKSNKRNGKMYSINESVISKDKITLKLVKSHDERRTYLNVSEAFIGKECENEKVRCHVGDFQSLDETLSSREAKNDNIETLIDHSVLSRQDTVPNTLSNYERLSPQNMASNNKQLSLFRPNDNQHSQDIICESEIKTEATDKNLIEDLNTKFEEYYQSLIKNKKNNNPAVTVKSEYEVIDICDSSSSDDEGTSGTQKLNTPEKTSTSNKTNLDPVKFVSDLLSTYSSLPQTGNLPPLSITVNIGDLPVHVNVRPMPLPHLSMDGPNDTSDESSDFRSDSGRKSRRKRAKYKPLEVVMQKSPQGRGRPSSSSNPPSGRATPVGDVGSRRLDRNLMFAFGGEEGANPSVPSSSFSGVGRQLTTRPSRKSKQKKARANLTPSLIKQGSEPIESADNATRRRTRQSAIPTVHDDSVDCIMGSDTEVSSVKIPRKNIPQTDVIASSSDEELCLSKKKPRVNLKRKRKSTKRSEKRKAVLKLKSTVEPKYTEVEGFKDVFGGKKETRCEDAGNNAKAVLNPRVEEDSGRYSEIIEERTGPNANAAGRSSPLEVPGVKKEVYKVSANLETVLDGTGGKTAEKVPLLINNDNDDLPLFEDLVVLEDNSEKQSPSFAVSKSTVVVSEIVEERHTGSLEVSNAIDPADDVLVEASKESGDVDLRSAAIDCKNDEKMCLQVVSDDSAAFSFNMIEEIACENSAADGGALAKSECDELESYSPNSSALTGPIFRDVSLFDESTLPSEDIQKELRISSPEAAAPKTSESSFILADEVEGPRNFTPKNQPPSAQEVISTMHLHNLVPTTGIKPYYSDYRDVTKQLEVGSKVLKVESPTCAGLKFHKSCLGVTSIEDHQKLLLGAQGVEAKYIFVKDRDVEITPLLKPPTRDDVEAWLTRRGKIEVVSEVKTKAKLLLPGGLGSDSEDDSATLTPCTPAHSDNSQSCTPVSTPRNFGPNSPEVGPLDVSTTPLAGPSKKPIRRVSFDESSISRSNSPITPKSRSTPFSKGRSVSPTLPTVEEGKLLLRKGPLSMIKGRRRLILKMKEARRVSTDSNRSTDMFEAAEEEKEKLKSAVQIDNCAEVLEKSAEKNVEGAEDSDSSKTSIGREKKDNSCMIQGVSFDNTFGFKASPQNLQQAKPRHDFQLITVLTVEVLTEIRGDYHPDPQLDAILAIFYSVGHDAPPNLGPVSEIGVFTVGDPLLGTAIEVKSTHFPDEATMLQHLLTSIRNWDPDILVGYEIEKGSWGYILQRGCVLGINLLTQMGRTVVDKQEPQSLDSQEGTDDVPEFIRHLYVPGRIVINAWRLLRKEIALTSYTFENVMFHLLHERHPLMPRRLLSHLWQHRTPRARWITAEYFLTCIIGLERILIQLDLVARTSELARLFGIQFTEVLTRGSQFRVESMMLRLAKPLNYVPVSPSITQRAHMRAPASLPLIMEPESQFYSDPVIVLDFQSLYPSMIIAYNYCFSTCLGRVSHLGRGDEPFEFGCTRLSVPITDLLPLAEENIHISPAGVAFVQAAVRKGVLPAMLEEILDTRLMVKRAMKESSGDKVLYKMLHARQLGLKLIANVTYGYTAANFSGRMPCIEVGDSVVSKGRETLQRAIRMVETTPHWRARVVYGDTDSLFVLTPGRTREEAFRIGAEIADAVTMDNPQPVKLKLEKVYQPCILQTKKRYVGYMYESPSQTQPVYDAKGIETVRRDGCPAVAKILQKALQILFDTSDVSQVKKYCVRQFAKLFQGRVNLQDLVFAKEYRGRKGYRPGASVPALQLARQWTSVDKRAEPRAKERVPYVIVHGAPGVPLIRLVRCPKELLKDSSLRIHAAYYITKALIPPLQRCFTLLGADPLAWYASMPRRFHRMVRSGLAESKRRQTISQYFAAIECVVCGTVSNTRICPDCSERPQKVIVALMDKSRRWERAYSAALDVCKSCCGRADFIDCESLDCPVLFRRHQLQQDQEQTATVRDIIMDSF